MTRPTPRDRHATNYGHALVLGRRWSARHECPLVRRNHPCACYLHQRLLQQKLLRRLPGLRLRQGVLQRLRGRLRLHLYSSRFLGIVA